MTLPDFADENVCRTFGNLPEVNAVDVPDSEWFLVAQIKQDMVDMTVTNPTLTLLDRDDTEFALVFADRDRNEVESLARLGFKKNATVVIPRAHRYRPNSAAAASQGFIRVGRDTEHEVRAIPATMDQVATLVECLKATHVPSEGAESSCQASCAGCEGHEDRKLRACTGCGEAKYCSKECQIKAWKAAHKANCKPIKIIKDIWLHA